MGEEGRGAMSQSEDMFLSLCSCSENVQTALSDSCDSYFRGYRNKYGLFCVSRYDLMTVYQNDQQSLENEVSCNTSKLLPNSCDKFLCFLQSCSLSFVNCNCFRYCISKEVEANVCEVKMSFSY